MFDPHTEGVKASFPPGSSKSENELQAALIARAPASALCGDAPHEAARETSRRPAEYALTQRFCKLNPRGRAGNNMLDLDHQHGLNLLAYLER